MEPLVRIGNVHLLHVNPDVLDHHPTDRARGSRVNFLLVSFHNLIVILRIHETRVRSTVVKLVEKIIITH